MADPVVALYAPTQYLTTGWILTAAFGGAANFHGMSKGTDITRDGPTEASGTILPEESGALRPIRKFMLVVKLESASIS